MSKSEMESVADPGFPAGGVDPLGECGPLMGHFSVKMYAKIKELGPWGVHRPLDPPMGVKVNDRCSCFLLRIHHSVGKLI